MAPPNVPLRCYTVSPMENRESQIARGIAKRLHVPWEFIPLRPQSYFGDLARRTLFTGSVGHGRFVHFVGVFEDTPVARENIVLGGFKADTFLKGHYLGSRKQMPAIGFQYLGQPNHDVARTRSGLFSKEVEDEVHARRGKHFRRIAEMRPISAEEWFRFWPMSQDHDIVHYWSNRRLFSSYEVFMSRRIATAAACLPQHWLLNRRLFQKVAQPYLRRLRWMPHGEGHFPALPWYANLLLRPAMRAHGKLRSDHRRGTQGTWPSLSEQFQSPELQQEFTQWLSSSEVLGIDPDRAATAVEDSSLTVEYRYAVLQVLAALDEMVKRGYSITADHRSILAG
jgi:hypothetical protein